jgi:hypothetical protein
VCCTTPRGPWPSCLSPTEATPPVQPLTAAIAGRVDSSPGSSPTHKAAARPTGTLTDSTCSCTDRSCSELRPRPAAASSWGDTVDHASLSRHDAEPSTGRVDLAVAILDWFRRQSIPSQTGVHDRPRPPGRTGLAPTARTQLRQPFAGEREALMSMRRRHGLHQSCPTRRLLLVASFSLPGNTGR